MNKIRTLAPVLVLVVSIDAFAARVPIQPLPDTAALDTELEPTRLTWVLSVRNGVVTSLAATNGTSGVFADLSDVDSRQFWNPVWNMMRVTVNGDALATPDGELIQRSDGFMMYLR